MRRCTRCNTRCPWLRVSRQTGTQVCDRCYSIEITRSNRNDPPGIVPAPYRTDYDTPAEGESTDEKQPPN